MTSTSNHRWGIFRRLLRRLGKSRLSTTSRALACGAALPEKTPDLPVEAVSSESEADKELEVAIVDPTAEWCWEGNVQKALIAQLMEDGWTIEGQADTASGQQGPDVVARRSDTLLLVEVKGYPSTVYVKGERAGQPKPTSPSLQAHHWFDGALATTIRRKGDHPKAQLAMAFPKVGTYSGLIERSAWALKVLDIWVFLIGQDGSVRLLTFSE